ncbi:MAG: hypothetical protein A3I24_03010 [Candidatus Harrisonbacteria bacterium RIFCSPLOWO2_02_FULL_41_13b]|uniref:Uncharacterized protein n=1 Tax=Candidatus Harrisonbacteria bacterium RIFCSPLOWO2_02_FULL_41_13b TaxID=1798409 RepID=A0A1G1ZSE5_9BACT|nr:MAG: hypothetical protein A3I24_03010 [Candidatus Harrisonbacteria bacterium RIFCSPLOWO2_02_FULL_41_13b]
MMFFSAFITSGSRSVDFQFGEDISSLKSEDKITVVIGHDPGMYGYNNAHIFRQRSDRELLLLFKDRQEFVQARESLVASVNEMATKR